MELRKKVVIVGGGFAGIKCAKTLRKKLSRSQYDILLFNRENHMVFHPLLAEVVGASLEPEAVAAPLRQMLPGIHCRTEDVQNIDLQNGIIEYESHDGFLRKLPYNHVVIAAGGVVNLGTMPGMADHAFPMKTIGDAIALRAHIMQQMEKAEVCDDEQKRRWYLSFIVVGGGYSGVEAAGEINDLTRSSLRFFQNIKKDDISVTLIHSGSQVLPEIGSDLRDFAGKKMQQAGIELLLNSKVAVATAEGVGLVDGREIHGATVVCTIGTTMSPVVMRLQTKKEKGRIVTEKDMSLPGYKNAWAIGDCAHILNSYNSTIAPPTGQFAEREGRQVAENIVCVERGEQTRPFSFRPLGQLCSIGGHTAVAEMFGIHLSGFFAWFVWRGVYLTKLPSFSRKVKVGFDWAWQLMFSRDLVHLKANLTERVCSAHYQPGDYFFRQGDPAANFYAIESGEVEVVRESVNGQEEVIAVLGAGSFFGEMALVNNSPRSASVRARTVVEVVVMGRNVFSQVSNSLAPMKELITSTVTKRSGGLWQKLPSARDILSRTSIRDFLEPIPGKLVKPESQLEDVVRMFEELELEFCYVSKDNIHIDGILTQADLLRALELGTTGVKVEDFMSLEPLVVAVDESCLLAATTMRDNDLKWLPVVNSLQERKIEGHVKRQTILAGILSKCSSCTSTSKPATVSTSTGV